MTEERHGIQLALKAVLVLLAIAGVIAAIILGLTKFTSQDVNMVKHTPEHIASPTEVEGGVESIVTGEAIVIDADTLKVEGIDIRLEGIDSVESNQQCGGRNELWPCGSQASAALREHLAEQRVACHTRGTDRYQRKLARCFIGTKDLQSWLVKSGWALAFRRHSMDYVIDENYAKKNMLGMWRGEFITPWDWRRNGERISLPRSKQLDSSR